MASMAFQAPAPFCFGKPDEWPKWKWRFEQSHVVSRLSDKIDERQANTLLYCLGADAEDILSITNITADIVRSTRKFWKSSMNFLLLEKRNFWEGKIQ